MAADESVGAGGSAQIIGGHVVSRRDFLKALGVAGVGLAVAPQLAAWAGGTGQSVASAADATDDPIARLAAALDYDAERIFRFVADEIRYEPYAGILRGARGTLAGRAGNSADQALLLAALLGASLLPVRFAIGELDSASADGLLASSVADADTLRQHTLDALAGLVPGQQASPGLTPEQQAQVDEAVSRGGQVVDWARDQLERTVGTIEATLAEAGIELADGFAWLPDSERAQHVWVQLAQTADWLDMDPTLPGAAPGMNAARSSETLDALPDEMAHWIELAVIGEVLDGEVLSEQALISLSDRADALAGLPVAIMNVPPESLAALGVGVGGAIGGGIAYVPAIVVGEDAVVGVTPIQLTPAGPHDGSSEAGDDLLASGTGAVETTAEWVELTIRSPGAEPVVVRREILDRLGPSRRAAGGIRAGDLAPVELIDAPDGSEAQAAVALSGHWLTVSTGLPSRDDAVLAVASDDDVSDRALISQAYRLLSAAAGLELAVPAGLRPFVDAPNVVAHSLLVRPGSVRPDAGDGQTVESVLDIWHRSHGSTPVAGVSMERSPAVTAGVLAHVVERVLGGEATAIPAEPAAGSPAGTVMSVGALFDQALSSGTPLLVIREPAAVAGMSLADDARARLAESVAQGWTAIVPERPVLIGGQERTGWWLVDPGTGRTVDELDDGRGQTSTEKTVIISRVALAKKAQAWRRLGLCYSGAMLLLAEGLSLWLAQAELASGNAFAGGVFGGLSGLSGAGAFGLLQPLQC